MIGYPVIQRLKWFVFVHFEQLLVVLLVAATILIHRYVDYRPAFLSFYALPVISAGFVGRRLAVFSAVFVVTLVAFFQAIDGVIGEAGFSADALYFLVPWGGFLILTGYVVGALAERTELREREATRLSISLLELVTVQLDATEGSARGHSARVADRAFKLGTALGLPESELERLRVAALLHEMDPHDPRLQRLMEAAPGARDLQLAPTLRSAMEVVNEYARYHSQVGDDWPADRVRVSPAAKILAVADAFETLQISTPARPAFTRNAALREIERGAGAVFASDVVAALRDLALEKGADGQNLHWMTPHQGMETLS
ncbi:MAG: metal dependent phosphohydrolase [Gemmatimonadetes bacterium]|nr:metal dependent phosphohydrolase [Gemmatimonadota bacterium]